MEKENNSVYDCSVAVKTEKIPSPLWVSSFHEGDGETERQTENSGEEYDGRGVYHSPEKKRRLKPEQVQFLEKSFEIENKLEPERKVHLAKEVGLQPRQVAIWFQNRRARSKTKLLEKEYTLLKSSYEKLKADYLHLFKENEQLRNEIKLLSEKMGVGEKGKMKEEEAEKGGVSLSPVTAAAARSEVFDSDSPHCPDSDFSQEEDESPCNAVTQAPFYFPKLEFESHDDDLQPNCCNLGFPVQNQGTWFWHY